MPSICGFSVRRSRRDVQFAAPYQGCHVTQQVRLMSVFTNVHDLLIRLWIGLEKLHLWNQTALIDCEMLDDHETSLKLFLAIFSVLPSVFNWTWIWLPFSHSSILTLQGGDYVLPLRLWGAPMTMSCPAVFPPPSVSCFPSGMVVKIGGITANGLKVKGSWLHILASGNCLYYLLIRY